MEKERKSTRSERRFDKKVNKKLFELVNAWFVKRMKMEDPDSQESLESLEYYNNQWRWYCNKMFKNPGKYINHFIDICDKKDKELRQYVARQKSMKALEEEWKDVEKQMKEEGKSLEEIANASTNFFKERSLELQSK